MNKTLKDWLPYEALSYDDRCATMAHAGAIVIKEISGSFSGAEIPFPSGHKFVYNWCVVKHTGRYYAVGWNENPGRGWSFPVIRLREHDLVQYGINEGE